MPGYDGSGPMGMGPMTGGARGRCNANNRFYGRKESMPGFGMGRGRGYRNMFWATGLPRWMRSALNWPGNYPVSYSKDEEMGFLKGQAAALRSDLDAIDDRLRALQSEEE
jgi:hypothetical protein